MKPSRRRLPSHALCIALFVGIGGGVASAQRAQGPRVPQLQPDSARVFPLANAHETRQELHELLQKHPPSVAQVLRLDPSLLTQPTYLETYPELAAFVAQHPEIVRDSVFFFGRGPEEGVYDNRARALNVWSDVLTAMLALFAFTALLTAFTWVIRSAIDYRRWLRLSKIQVEVHGKLMDRLSSNEDLLAYMQSSAGRRFLEAAPIPVDSGARALSAPVGRILWSAQAGVVLALGGLGLQFVSGRVVEELAQGLYVMGVFGSALGLGFILSAVVAYVLSRRLGLVESVTLSANAEAGGPNPRV
ncbi:MAG: hypothetical protein EHM89_15840 [Acidobacteria bacterium]|nr:MAG: hypothetical protein EHM89_15840 [Acidobacteriota bacterium]